MKKVWNFLVHHIGEDFNKKHYLTIAVFLALSLFLNYQFEFEDNYLESLEGFEKFYSYLIFYSVAYFFSVFSYAVFSNQQYIFFRREFWIKSLFAMLILSFDSSAPFLHDLTSKLVHPQVEYYAYKVLFNAMSLFTVFIPILIFYFFTDKDQKHVYGLNAHKFDTRPYFTMLIIMLPLIIIASFNPGFVEQYPMYSSTSAHVNLGVPEWTTIAVYETTYGLDFINVEFLFRGFMVIGMISVLGRGAVLSMAVVYCFLHFGKPAGEAISSVFGGYILGVIAYETTSIWGGIIVHMGIAWMMELVAFVQKNL